MAVDEEKVQRHRQRWLETIYRKATTRFPERKPRFETGSGIPLPPVETPADVTLDYLEAVSYTHLTLPTN